MNFLWGVFVGALVAGIGVRIVSERREKSRVPVFTEPVTSVEVVPEPDIDYLAVLNGLPLGVVVADPSGKVLVRNQAAASLVGLRHVDILVEQAVERLMDMAISTSSVSSEQLELFGPPPRTLIVVAMPLEIGGAMAVIEDVTERSRIDAVRTDFVANISHELKTPVGALSILAETIQDETDPEVVRMLAAKMVREAQRMSDTISDLLELSRIEMDGTIEHVTIDVAEIVSEAVERNAFVAAQAGVALSSTLPLDVGRIAGDRTQLISALSNLIDNAVKYSDKGGTVRVDAQRSDDQVRITVCDDGIGIPQTDQERIFERFYRVDRARSRGTGGTGLGLSIVRHIMSNHGGQVNVSSREGEGSTFVLTLPTVPDDTGGNAS
jgi:two-component system sensor histidine kinase SenX3